MIAVLALPPETLANQKAPLATILFERGQWATTAISLISMVAVINGALIQIIMASRVLYGMSGQGVAPKVFSAVNAKTQTPIKATIAVTVVIMILAVGFPLVSLANATSTVTLVVFALVNAALWRTKRKGGTAQGATSYPIWVPAIGFLLCVGCLAANFLLQFG
jgi:amino acid transporter